MSKVSNGKSDAEALLGSEEVELISIYRVYFDMLLVVEGADEPIKINDSLDVAAGNDAREAQNKVETYVLNSGKYPAEMTEFFITGSKLLASTEI